MITHYDIEQRWGVRTALQGQRKFLHGKGEHDYGYDQFGILPDDFPIPYSARHDHQWQANWQARVNEYNNKNGTAY